MAVNIGDTILAYCPKTKELKGVVVAQVPDLVINFMDCYTQLELTPEAAVRVLAYFNPEIPIMEFLFDPTLGMVVPKPKFKLTADKTTAVGDGVDVCTVKVELFDYQGNALIWDRVTIKDENERVQISTTEMDYGQDNSTFRVRAPNRCTGRIRVKEKQRPGQELYDSAGLSFFKYTRCYLELPFTNPGF